jgi:predicted nucleotidyltransferase
MRSCVISLVILVLAVTSACNPGQSTPLATATPTRVAITTNPTLGALSGLARVVNTDSLSVWAAEADRQVAQDVAQAIQSNSEKICAELRTACQFQVVVEIYPDQCARKSCQRKK